ncbi:cysteine protease [Niallia circulans]|jgi:protease I|uniref:Cysteine protease n=1 Tax=Niallia circulans TaxID=1397 RepID=A0A0J1LCQ6_NIACI|nr:type 1 glutamine amidotransferase domain-containing protein [Niallia circulans]KLV26750.1 cysteine protease [Niallia circulans]
MSKKIATLITDMFEDSEYTEPAKAYKEAGHEVVTIELEAGKTVEGKQKEASVTIDKGIDEVSPDEFDALFIPGGFSPDQLRVDDRIVAFAKAFMDAKKPVFAICHGPQLLITAKALEGRNATGYKSIKVDMEYAGVTFKDEEVVVCGEQLVTSRTPEDIPAFNRESLKLLNK